MRDLNTSELARVLQVDRWLIDQLISRGIFTPKVVPAPGRPRLWNLSEAMRVAALLSVAAWVPLFRGRPRKLEAPRVEGGPDQRTDAERIADILSRTPLHGFTDEGAFLLVTATRFPGGGSAYDAEVVRASRLSAAVQRPLSKDASRVGATKVDASLLIDLGEIESRLLEAWPNEPS